MLADHYLKNSADNWAGLLFRIILDAVFPPRCLACSRFYKPVMIKPGLRGAINAKTETMEAFTEFWRRPNAYCCPQCMRTFTVVSAPLCNCCGIMFESRQGRNHYCGDCMAQPKQFRVARAALAANPQLMTLIHRFKYAGKIQLAGLLGELMVGAVNRMWDRAEFDRVLPVPLDPKKFRKRGFNQSYLLIHSWKSIPGPSAGELSAIPVCTDVLLKSRETAPQTGLDRRQRFKNIKGAFRVRSPQEVNAKKVLLVDDVYTTGATVNECARVLLKAGAEAVDVLTVVRVM